ncbi:MAG: hypothetical protein K8R53_00155 [Bacteroidales bacterium]|nr:hypothetical protein [Bacteroidales bacterium]
MVLHKEGYNDCTIVTAVNTPPKIVAVLTMNHITEIGGWQPMPDVEVIIENLSNSGSLTTESDANGQIIVPVSLNVRDGNKIKVTLVREGSDRDPEWELEALTVPYSPWPPVD